MLDWLAWLVRRSINPSELDGLVEWLVSDGVGARTCTGGEADGAPKRRAFGYGGRCGKEPTEGYTWLGGPGCELDVGKIMQAGSETDGTGSDARGD